MKSEKTLAEFTTYCKANPEQRFWQALKNFSGAEAILTLRMTPEAGSWRITENIEEANKALNGTGYELIDTFYE